MPTNLYGPGDNFDLEKSHVLPALIRKFHDAKLKNEPAVVLWGTGTALREFLHVDDMADASLFLLQHYDDGEIVNIGVGQDISIADLAGIVQEVVGYAGRIEYDSSKPDGTPRKLVDVSKIRRLGWRATIELRAGIEQTYRWFLENHAALRGIAQ
jgi:GDP-L-fucose synthase